LVSFNFNKEEGTSPLDVLIKDFIVNNFGYVPKNAHVYKLAFLHKSAAIEIKEGIRISNERLEFLGDAILGAVIADYVYKKYPFKDEGFLTDMRSKIVCRNRLNKLSGKLGMDALLNAHTDIETINRDVLGNTFEALIGAIYIDKGFDFTTQIIFKKIIGCHLDIDEIAVENNNFKSIVISWAQSHKKNLHFKTINQSRDGRHILYEVHLFIDNVMVSKGMDTSIKRAEQNAAENYLKLIKI